MRQRRRNLYIPSSGAKLAALITQRFPLTYGQRSITPESARKYLTGRSEAVARLAGPAGAEWAINQLSTPPLHRCWMPAQMQGRADAVEKGGQ